MNYLEQFGILYERDSTSMKKLEKKIRLPPWKKEIFLLGHDPKCPFFLMNTLANSYEFQYEKRDVKFLGVTSKIVSARKSFLHWSMSAHICFVFSISNFLAFRNLVKQWKKSCKVIATGKKAGVGELSFYISYLSEVINFHISRYTIR